MIEETRLKIINAAIMAFNRDGVRFTMDSVATATGMSKKTLYKYFESKDELILAAVNAGFDEVKLAEQRLIQDDSLDIIEKIKRVITVIPEQYISVDWRKLREIAEYSPQAFVRINERLSSGWDSTFVLLNTAMDQKKLRKVNLQFLKCMIESCIGGFISDDTLIRENIDYTEALSEMINIMIEGLRL